MSHLRRICTIIACSSFLFNGCCRAQPIEVAITVDDLPAHGELPKHSTRMDIVNHMLDVFKKHDIKKVYGFINGIKIAEDKENKAVLEQWIMSGQLLGNHSYSHLDLAQTDIAPYIADIDMNSALLSKLMGSNSFRYYRYPFLAEGETQIKRDAIREFLFENHYQVAPVTVDFFDYEWNAPYLRCLNSHNQQAIDWLKKSYIQQALNALTISHELSNMLLSRDIKNVLLIHVGAFDALMLDDLLTAYEQHGVKFITLPDALEDEAYKINPNIITKRPYTFLNQLRLAQGKDNPEIVKKLYDDLPEEKLTRLCR